MSESKALWCPSHRCKSGSQLLGVRQEDGTIAILPAPLPVDESFVEKTKNYPMAPEQRFRFTNKCFEGACGQWTGSCCGVVERIVQHLELLPVIEELPVCGIRDKCRWYSQQKSAACKVCPFILTEITEAQILEAQMQEFD
jgi:hypothetical protein